MNPQNFNMPERYSLWHVVTQPMSAQTIGLLQLIISAVCLPSSAQQEIDEFGDVGNADCTVHIHIAQNYYLMRRRRSRCCSRGLR